MASALLSSHSIMERTAAFEISVKTMQETDAKTAREALINPCDVFECVEWLSALLGRCELAIMWTIKGPD